MFVAINLIAAFEFYKQIKNFNINKYTVKDKTINLSFLFLVVGLMTSLNIYFYQTYIGAT